MYYSHDIALQVLGSEFSPFHGRIISYLDVFIYPSIYIGL